MFIGRERELQFLEAAYAQRQPHLIILYGRRRVGKTELVKQFFRGKDHIYFLADKSSEQDQRRQLSERMAAFFQDDFLRHRGFGRWEDVFRYLAERLPGQKRKLIFVVDEFPYLVESNPAVSSIFQKGFDEYLKDSGLFLILMGSSVAMMESETLAYKAPLYGRRTGQIRLEPLDFQASTAFFPQRDFTEHVSIYATLGGMPAYLQAFDPALDFWSNVPPCVLTPLAFLYQEPEFLLREELREPRHYFSILRALAHGCSKFGQIVNETGLEKNVLGKYLGVLSDLHLVSREVPVTEKVASQSKQGSYRLQDPFLRFWFRFVFPHRSEIEEGRARGVLEQRIKPQWDAFVPWVYERIALEAVKGWASTIDDLVYERYGRWWSRTEEIDLVALDESSRRVLFGEVKWSRSKVGTNILDDLRRKAEQVPWHKGARQEQWILFNRSGFTDALLTVARKEKILLVEGTRRLAR